MVGHPTVLLYLGLLVGHWAASGEVPQDHLKCTVGAAAQVTSSMSCADYDSVLGDINALTGSFPSCKGSAPCPRDKWVQCLLRLATQDLKAGGADGCADLSGSTGSDIAGCIRDGVEGSHLTQAYQQHCRHVSLADFIVIAAEAAMTLAQEPAEGSEAEPEFLDFRSSFRFGRSTVKECDTAISGGTCVVFDGLRNRSKTKALAPAMASELGPCSCLKASNVSGSPGMCLALATSKPSTEGLCGLTLEQAAASGFAVPDCAQTQPEEGWNQHRGEWLAAVRGAWTRATERGQANLKPLDCKVVKPTYPPSGALPDGWRHLEGRNCWEGNGASDLEANSSLSGRHTLSFCITACQDNPECEGLIMQSENHEYLGPCWLRKNVQVASCGRDPHFGLWLRGEATPDKPSGGGDASGFPVVVSTLTKAWAYHPGHNCWTGHGALPVPDGDPASGSLSVPQCQSACEAKSECEGVIVSGTQPGKCWLRRNVEVSACQHNAAFSLWLRTPNWEWAHRDNTNCYNGRGARWLPGSAGRLSIEQCQAACIAAKRCRGFVVERASNGQPGPCFLRADVNLAECEVNNAYIMWFMGIRGNTTTEATTTSIPTTSGATPAVSTQETSGSSTLVNAHGFAKIERGSCISAGLVAISGRAICEVAAAKLGLADTDASTTHVAERPEGCYYSPGHGHRLWMGMNPQSKGRGAETSIEGAPRYPICATLQALQQIAAATMQNTAAKFELRLPSPVRAAPRSWSLGSLRMDTARLLGFFGLIGLVVLALLWRRASTPAHPHGGARQAPSAIFTKRRITQHSFNKKSAESLL